MSILRTCVAIGAFVIIAGCASTSPKMIYPLLPAPGAIEQGLDCAALTDQLEKADAIRWSIRESGVRRPAGSGTNALVAMGYMLGVATLIVDPAMAPMLLSGPPSNTPVYALARADTRIQKLLVIKAAKACPASTTSVAGVSDAELLGRLDALDQSYRAKQLKEKQLLIGRTQLLDSLRDPVTLRPPALQ